MLQAELGHAETTSEGREILQLTRYTTRPGDGAQEFHDRQQIGVVHQWQVDELLDRTSLRRAAGAPRIPARTSSSAGMIRPFDTKCSELLQPNSDRAFGAARRIERDPQAGDGGEICRANRPLVSIFDKRSSAA